MLENLSAPPRRLPVHLLIKPASSRCNLRCSYCFYHSLAAQRQTADYGIMTPETLEAVVRRGCEEAGGSITFAFQGGEPTIAGLDFFRHFESLIKIYAPPSLRVDRALQTNGLLLNMEWIAFLKEHNYLVGLSLDGPADTHDLHRRDAAGRGTQARVMQAAKLLAQENAAFNILTVVTGQTARHGKQLWQFLRKNGFDYLQFIPCLDPLGEKPGRNPWSLTPERYASFLKTTFDLWFAELQSGKLVSVRLFDNFVGMLAGEPPENCGMSGLCACQCVVEADGGVYPCDFYVDDMHLLGNIRDKSLTELREGAAAFLAESQPLSVECSRCEFYPLCRGGCRRYREPFQDGQPSLYSLCPAIQDFFRYALPRMQALAATIVRR